MRTDLVRDRLAILARDANVVELRRLDLDHERDSLWRSSTLSVENGQKVTFSFHNVDDWRRLDDSVRDVFEQGWGDRVFIG